MMNTVSKTAGAAVAVACLSLPLLPLAATQPAGGRRTDERPLAPENGAFGAERLARVRGAMSPLRVDGVQSFSADEQAYFAFYGLDIPAVRHHFGALRAATGNVAVHVFAPATPRATALVVHGYYDHVGVMAPLIRRLAADGLAVVAYDQPGHGLSDGARVTIEDFARYTEVLETVVTWCERSLDSPQYCLAHSMGCAIVADLLLVRRSSPFGRVVMLAPLVRSAHWNLSRFGNAVAAPFVDAWPRMFRRNSSDQAFLEFARRDPLQDRTVPLQWFRALRGWNVRMKSYRPLTLPAPPCIIQGTEDSTTDWHYCLKTLHAKFPGATVTLIEGAGHQLMNESPPLRDQVFALVDRTVADVPGGKQ